MKDPFHRNKQELSALDAQYNAQRIAFAPVIFQAARSLRDLGVLSALDKRKEGMTIAELVEASSVRQYGLEVLLESGMSADVVYQDDERWHLTKTGWFLLRDEMTNINMDYNHYVSYQALFYLDKSLEEGRPVGLERFGDWPVIYNGLSELPPAVRDSWFRFDHYYSNSACEPAIEKVVAMQPSSVLEIGGNQGNFSRMLATADPSIKITLLDLPEQVELAKQFFSAAGFDGRIRTVAADVLGDEPLPGNYDVVWMSQFLDCFSKNDIVSILSKAREALADNGRIMVMEPLWDRQRFETAAYCIVNTSPYFTVMANGCSKMYSFADFERCVEDAGLSVNEVVDDLGLCQTILVCR